MQKFLIPFACQFLVSLTQGLAIDGREAEAVAQTWSVHDVNRRLVRDTNQIDLSMVIDDGSWTGVFCEVIATAPPNTDITTWSFSDYKCLNKDWSIYWGYQSGNDGAVMTVVSPGKDKRAFFGFSHINTQTYLGKSGPSPVESM